MDTTKLNGMLVMDRYTNAIGRIVSIRDSRVCIDFHGSMECREPDDVLSARYERWESRKEQLEEQISDLNDEISDLELEYEV